MHTKSSQKSRIYSEDVENNSSSFKNQPLLDEEWNVVFGRILNFNKFIDIIENVTSKAEMIEIQEMAAEIQENTNLDE